MVLSRLSMCLMRTQNFEFDRRHRSRRTLRCDIDTTILTPQKRHKTREIHQKQLPLSRPKHAQPGCILTVPNVLAAGEAAPNFRSNMLGHLKVDAILPVMTSR